MTVAHLLSFLRQRGHQVDFYTLDLDGEMSPVQSEWLEAACNSVQVFRHSMRHKLWGLIRGTMRLTPLQVSLFWNRRMAAKLKSDLGRGSYDVVYSYYARTAPAVEYATRSRTVTRSFLALQLSQTLNTRRMAKYDSRGLWKLVYSAETFLMGRYESRVWQRFDHTMLIGPADVAAIEAECVRYGQPKINNWIYGAHGTDTSKYVQAQASEVVPARVVFSGSMLYPPNVQAVLWFARTVWPLIKIEMPDAEFIVQGRDPADEIRALHGRNDIVVTGTVPDVGEIIRSAAVCVNPMLAAGGMQNKLLEYMASAKAVVATTVANEGIRAPDGTVRIADDPETFASAVLSLLRDSDAAHELGQAASRYVREHWTWESHFLKLEDSFLGGTDHHPSKSF